MAKYIQGKKIGSGTYSNVYEALDTEFNQTVALKKIILNENEGIPSTTLREISILKILNHKNIINLLNIIHKEEFLIMVLEYVEYDLLTFIEKFQHTKLSLIHQLIYGLHFIHSNNIIHRDLKPANILVTKHGQLKIADFGLARIVNLMDSGYSSEVITLWYRPPELLNNTAFYSFEVDIWSLGCIIYEIITNKPLFFGKNKEHQLELIKAINLTEIEHELSLYKIPNKYTKIVIKCLEKNPSLRISIGEIVLLLDSI